MVLGVALIFVAAAVAGRTQFDVGPLLVSAVVLGIGTYLRGRKQDEAKAWSEAVRVVLGVAAAGITLSIVADFLADPIRSVVAQQYGLWIFLAGFGLLALGASLQAPTPRDGVRTTLGLAALGSFLVGLYAVGIEGFGSRTAYALLGLAAALIVAAHAIERRKRRSDDAGEIAPSP
jgi:hypothetical protein